MKYASPSLWAGGMVLGSKKEPPTKPIRPPATLLKGPPAPYAFFASSITCEGGGGLGGEGAQEEEDEEEKEPSAPPPSNKMRRGGGQGAPPQNRGAVDDDALDGRMGGEDAVHEVALPATHVVHGLAGKLGPRPVGHHGVGAEGVEAGHGGGKLGFALGLVLEELPDSPLLERVRRVRQVPRNGARRVRKHLGELGPGAEHVLGVMGNHGPLGVGVVLAQHRGERRVDEAGTAVGRGLGELEDAVGGAREHEALDDRRLALHRRGDLRGRHGAVRELVGNVKLLRHVDENRFVVAHGHVLTKEDRSTTTIMTRSGRSLKGSLALS
mmetsp:Transcript_14777/g.34814  ORF Transcript_14777/g.34814 Transcript_14777/m.34814 type:complete len:325 (-) Transcript_14777:300-1274(-)